MNEHRLEGQRSGVDPLPQGTTSASRETTYNNNNLPSHIPLVFVLVQLNRDIYLFTAAHLPTDMTAL